MEKFVSEQESTHIPSDGLAIEQAWQWALEDLLGNREASQEDLAIIPPNEIIPALIKAQQEGGEIGVKRAFNALSKTHSWIQELRSKPLPPRAGTKQNKETCQNEKSTPIFAIKDEKVRKALTERNKQEIYTLASEIAEMPEIEQDRIRLAIQDIFEKTFPMREFNGLLKSAKIENERKKQTKPIIFSARELMKKQFAPVDYIVPDILPVGLIVLAGKQKIGKSWIDLNLALAVASGGIVFNKDKVKQGDVLYMALEDNERRLQERVKVLMSPGSEVPNNLDMVTTWPKMDKDGIALLEQWIVSHPNARLVIIDPWVMVKPIVKITPGSTGYDAEYEAFAGIKALADKYGICILVQFHLRKAVAEDYVDTINATTGVTACADGFLVLQRLRGEEGASLRGTGRDFKEDVDLVMNFKGGIWSIPGDSNPAYYKLNLERRAVIDILNSAAGPMQPKDIATLLDIRQDAMRQLLKKMRDNDQVEDTGQGYISLIPTTPSKDNPFPGWNERESEISDHADHAIHSDHVVHSNHAPELNDTEPIETTDVIDTISVIGVIDDNATTSTDIFAERCYDETEYWALGKKHNYPDIPDLDLRGGIIGWNSFLFKYRLRIPDVIARLAR